MNRFSSPLKPALRLFALLVSASISGASLFAAPIALNLSNASNKNIASGATVEGIDNWINSTTGSNYNTPRLFTIEGVSGWQMAADYWQQNMSANLPQPWYSVMGGRAISGNAGYQAFIQFTGLHAWLNANSYAAYQVTVYYGGINATSQTGQQVARFYSGEFSGSGSFDPLSLIFLGTDAVGTSQGNGTVWGNKSSVGFAADADDLLIAVPYVANVDGGIAAVTIVGVVIPEPSTYAAVGTVLFAGLFIVRRRRS